MSSPDVSNPDEAITEDDVNIRQRLLPHTVSQGLWASVGEILKGDGDISSEQRSWAVTEASKHARDHAFVHHILPHCCGQDLDHALTHLVSRGLWRAAGEVLGKGVSSDQRRWAVETAVHHASDDDFLAYLSHHCQDEDVEHLVTHLVSRGLWTSASDLLTRGVSAGQLRWAVDQACQRADDCQFEMSFLPHCTDEQLVQVSAVMAQRGLWTPADNVALSDLSNTQHHVLSQIVSQGLWEVVGTFLQRDIGHDLHRWAVVQASTHADYHDFVYHVLPQCRDEEMSHVLRHLVTRGQWQSVGRVLERGVTTPQRRWAVAEACQNASIDRLDLYVLPHCAEDDAVAVFCQLVANRRWRGARCVLYSVVRDALYTWVTANTDRGKGDAPLWKFVFQCRIEKALALELTKFMAEERQFRSGDSYESQALSNLVGYTSCHKVLCKLLMVTLVQALCSLMCGGREPSPASQHSSQGVPDIYQHILDCVRANADSIRNKPFRITKNDYTAVFTEIADSHEADPLFPFQFLKGLNQYYVNRRGLEDDVTLLVTFAVFPLFPQLQSTSLRRLVYEQRWDVLSQACLSHVWEHDRRQLFRTAVEQREWGVVRQWADHTVHDDQRDWAMKEAFREEQWQVYLLLADHGLTMQEHMHAHYILAKYGDWDTVLQMVERGGDITEVSNLLESWVTGHLRKKPKGDAAGFVQRCEELIRLRLRFAKNSALRPRKNLESWMWGSVLFNVLHEPTEEYFSQVLHKVLEEEEWHILMHLVRLGMNQAERDWLFPQMVSRQQWGVCRKLLEIGVDVRLCLEALPTLLEKKQWTLVGRVMEYQVDDAARRQVMQRAFQRREGALFWHCLTTMLKEEEALSAESRVELFHEAIRSDAWQAVKPLVEKKEKDNAQDRDLAFLEAIEQHLWDVVDHCQVLGADINMKDENGETPLHRQARGRAWKAVEEIVLREGDPNLLDQHGVSVLNQLIDSQQWRTVQLVITHGGDIHQPAKKSRHLPYYTLTPLQALIDHRQGDVIHFTVLWCPEQNKGVNSRGETTLHAVCDSEAWAGMEDLLVRQVDALAVTETGQTALVYAVLNTHCPHRMVAECCRLGFSSHQPAQDFAEDSLLPDVVDTVVDMWSPVRQHENSNLYHVWSRRQRRSRREFVKQGVFKYFDCDYMQRSVITSPLLCAALRDLPVVILLLFQSGCSSRADLLTLGTQLEKLIDRNTEEGWALYEQIVLQIQKKPSSEKRWLQKYSRLTQVLEKNVGLMRQLATSPRTLLSCCRLVILGHFHFRDKKRLERLRQLPLRVPLKNYLEFSDFWDYD